MAGCPTSSGHPVEDAELTALLSAWKEYFYYDKATFNIIVTRHGDVFFENPDRLPEMDTNKKEEGRRVVNTLVDYHSRDSALRAALEAKISQELKNAHESAAKAWASYEAMKDFRKGIVQKLLDLCTSDLPFETRELKISAEAKTIHSMEENVRRTYQHFLTEEAKLQTLIAGAGLDGIKHIFSVPKLWNRIGKGSTASDNIAFYLYT